MNRFRLVIAVFLISFFVGISGLDGYSSYVHAKENSDTSETKKKAKILEREVIKEKKKAEKTKRLEEKKAMKRERKKNLEKKKKLKKSNKKSKNKKSSKVKTKK